jgi:hypothetical protein
LLTRWSHKRDYFKELVAKSDPMHTIAHRLLDGLTTDALTKFSEEGPRRERLYEDKLRLMRTTTIISPPTIDR